MLQDDLPLGQPRARPVSPAPPPAPPGSFGSVTRWVVVGAAAVLAVALLAFWWLNRTQVTPTTPAPTTATDVAIKSNRPKRQNLALPVLDDSDTVLRGLVGALSRHPLVARLVATPSLVRGLALTIVQIGDGRTPAVSLKVLRPTDRPQIVGTTNGPIDRGSYARWDGPVAALTSVNPAEAAQVYVNIKPLVDQAYHELGHPGDFDDALARAIRMLASTPTPSPDAELLRRPGYFEYDDPALRALKPVQKQFLLMGPANRQRVMTWLHALAVNLDLKLD